MRRRPGSEAECLRPYYRPEDLPPFRLSWKAEIRAFGAPWKRR
jgi:hypothetical protein